MGTCVGTGHHSESGSSFSIDITGGGYDYSSLLGRVAQLVEHHRDMVGVAGSSPVSPTKVFWCDAAAFCRFPQVLF